jgi:hypothetical protein
MQGDDTRLTSQELDALNRIGEAFYAFDALDPYHPSDRDEFIAHVHAMGRIIIARCAMRAHPSEDGSSKRPHEVARLMLTNRQGAVANADSG